MAYNYKLKDGEYLMVVHPGTGTQLDAKECVLVVCDGGPDDGDATEAAQQMLDEGSSVYDDVTGPDVYTTGYNYGYKCGYSDSANDKPPEDDR